ncbi:MAG: hypothetical protein WA840_24105 [Caulobacteraceae bacterium]
MGSYAPPAAPSPIDGLTHADALEEAHREVPDRPWGRIAVVALVMTALLMGGWEELWRQQGFQAGDIKNGAAAWAAQRRRAEGDATVLIGSSRNLFDVDLDVWQKATGVRPVQLSLEGTSPRFVLADLAKDPKFHGLVVADVVTDQFFGEFAGRGGAALGYFKNETPSQRVGRLLSILPEDVFAYIDDETRPKNLWAELPLPLPLRKGQRPYLHVYKIGVSEADRNSRIWDRELTDKAYRERSIRTWRIISMPRPGDPKPNIPKVISEVAANVAKIRARGGDAVFVKHPLSGVYAELESRYYPRRKFWDVLLTGTHTVGINYEDHPELRGFRMPEQSHLDPRDAKTYTGRLAALVENSRRIGATRGNISLTPAAVGPN